MPKPVPRNVTIAIFFIAMLLALLAMVGVGVTFAYRGVFYPGVSVDGVPLGGKTASEGKQLLDARSAAAVNRIVTVAMPDITKPIDEQTGLYPEQRVDTSASELGYVVPNSEALDAAWKIGHGNDATGWLKEMVQLFFKNGYNVALTPTVDEGKVHEFVVTKVVANASPPQPARVLVDGKEVTIQDQVPGLAVDEPELTRQITAALTARADTAQLSLRLPAQLEESSIGRSAVEPIASQLNALGNTRVTLTADGVTLTPARAELLQWYTPVLSEGGEVALGLNSERIASYLSKNGRQLDQKKSLAAVKREAEAWLKEPKAAAAIALTLKPTAEATPGEYKAGLFEGKYVYVNLKDQKLYRMNGQAMEKVYRVSTGKWSTPTPRGTFHIRGKLPRPYSRPYGLYMPYWQNFVGTTSAGEELSIGDYGLHELPEWPNGYKEGQGHLGTAVSHGCVRLGVGDAKEIYEWTEIGTPVVIE